MKTKDIRNFEKKYILQTYTRYPVILDKGKGVYVYDINGKKYLDFLAGISVNNLGYGNEDITKIVTESAKKLIHTSNLFYLEPQIEFAKKVSDASNKGKLFFANSGAEANESAIKLARAYGNSFNPPRRKIISLKNSFHGRTLATIYATGQKKYQKGFEPKLSGFVYAKANDIDGLKKMIDNKTSAIIIEFVQGEGGVNVLEKEFVKEVYKVCKKNGIIFIADEIQTGLGRTGKLFAYQHYGVVPDVITLAKSIAAGFPMGAMTVKNKYAKFLKAGMHASTFGGGYLVTKVANYVFDTVSSKKFLDKVEKNGNYFKDRLNELKDEFGFIKEVKGFGLMLALELNINCKDIVLEALENGLIINCIQNKILRFLPPLIISREEIDIGIEILKNVFSKIKT